MISVIIPLFNKEKTIEKTIKSILNQNYNNFEIIIINDGSYDNSADIVSQMKDSRIKLFDQVNNGQSSARNNGISKASGNIVAFLDGDDCWEKNHLETIMDLSYKYNNASLYATAYNSLYSNNFSLVTQYLPRNKESCIIKDYFNIASSEPFIWVSAVAVKREVFSKIGLFIEKEHRGADREMWARIALNFNIAYTSKITAIYNCKDPGQETKKSRKLQFPPLINLLDKAIDNGSSIEQNKKSLIKYKNKILFGYFGKALSSNDIIEIKNHIKLVRIINFITFIKIIFWKVSLYLPSSVPLFILSAIHSRYLYYLKIKKSHYGIMKYRPR